MKQFLRWNLIQLSRVHVRQPSYLKRKKTQQKTQRSQLQPLWVKLRLPVQSLNELGKRLKRRSICQSCAHKINARPGRQQRKHTVATQRYSTNALRLRNHLNQSLSDESATWKPDIREPDSRKQSYRKSHSHNPHTHNPHTHNPHKIDDTITYSVQRSEVIATLKRQLDTTVHLDSSQLSIFERRAHSNQPCSNSSLSDAAAETPSGYEVSGYEVSASSLPDSASSLPDKDSANRSVSELIDRAFLAECKAHYKAAEVLYLESLGLCSRTLASHIASNSKQQLHDSRLYALRQLATLYVRQNRYEEAEPLLNQALQLQSQSATEDEFVGECSYQLAKIYQHQQRYAEADELFQRAFSLFSQHLGSDHPHTRAVYRDLMQLLMSSIETGKFEELNAGSTPLDLDNLSDVYSWAKPIWQR